MPYINVRRHQQRQADINTVVKNVREGGELHYIDAAMLLNCSCAKASRILEMAARMSDDLEYERGVLRKK